MFGRAAIINHLFIGYVNHFASCFFVEKWYINNDIIKNNRRRKNFHRTVELISKQVTDRV